jgi:mannosyltransferase OCH1-like enzyme
MNSRILHLTWKDKNLSEKHLLIFKRWIKTNPNLKIKFYTDEENEIFIKSKFPEFQPILDKFERVVMKMDLIRLLYLWEYGGVYSDMDVLPLKNIEPLLDLNEVVLCMEDSRNSKNFNEDYIISNAVIIAKPKSDFIKKLIESIVENSKSEKVNSNSPNDILYLTGPLLYNNVYKSYNDKSSITLLDSNYFNPMNLEDLKSDFISNSVTFSYLVHLYDGTWWNSKWDSSVELLNKIINKHDFGILSYTDDFQPLLPLYMKSKIPTFPKISCLCVTKNDYSLVSKSIDCFLNQTYPNKELIVVYEDDNKVIENIIKDYNNSNIKYLKIKTIPKKTLGELRNISINSSTGDYICQWDDDDWYHPLRLWEQFRHCKLNKKGGSILKSWLIYDSVKNNLYSCERKIISGWEGSFLYKKSLIKELYPLLSKGEDTTFIEKIQHDLSVLNKPELYVYRVHTVNTWGYDGIYDKIIKWSKNYSGILDWNFLKNSNLESINNSYGSILLNNEPFELNNFSKFEKKYETGIIIPIFGRIKEVDKMLKTLSNSNIDKNQLIIFIDETNSEKSPDNNYKNVETSDLLKSFTTNKFNHIKIFKQIWSDGFNSVRTGLDILENDFDCKYYITLDSDVLLKPDWYQKITNKILLDIKKDFIISGYSKDFTDEKNTNIKNIENIFTIPTEVGKNLLFKKDLYKKIRKLIIDKLWERRVSSYLLTNNGGLFCLYESVIEHIGRVGINSHNETFFDVSSNFFFNFKDLFYIYNEFKLENKIPPIVHRILLDSDFSESQKSAMKRFKKLNPGFFQILWCERDILKIMNEEECDIYCGYPLKDQKINYSKYIILKYFGGLYCDLELISKKDFYELFQNINKNDLFFESSSVNTINDQIIMSLPDSKNIQSLLDMCKLRKDFKVKNSDDISYTTGTNLINEWFNQNTSKRLPKKYCEMYFDYHQNQTSEYQTKDFKISVVMQSFLGDYPGSRSNPEMKFIRAVNSFLDQTNKNSELIIVSDNCKITEKLYKKHFSKNERVKFSFYKKKREKMYSNAEEGKINYVGEPRQVGLEMSTGDIVTYMDSDDFFVKNYLEVLHKYWSYNPELDWIINRGWYDNSKVVNEGVANYNILFEPHYNESVIKIENIDGEWIRGIVKKAATLQSPGLISHKRNCDVKWSNISAGKSISEDIVFYKDIMSKYKNGIQIHIFGYVRCHLKNEWDF